jgi:hypothetical protein
MEAPRLLAISNIKVHIFLVTVISVISLACSGCASMLRIDGPYEGKVMDADTKLPIEGAVVHGSWSKRHLGGYGEYYDSYEVLTDKHGDFKIPGKGLLVLSEVEQMGLTIFKTGYEQRQENSVWSGLKKAKWPNGQITWEGNKGIFKLRRLTYEERRERSVFLPAMEPGKKQRFLRVEYNKEMMEIGKPTGTLLPVE